MGMFLRLPHGFLRRHLSTLERVGVAAVFSYALYQLMVALPVYPGPWQIVVAVMVFLVMLWSAPVAFFLAVIAALYPIYTISLYLAVLFLAVALLGQRVFVYNLGATLLVLSVPWLAQYHLEWLPVLLGGLWWGKSGGAWIGGFSALWGQMLFGMTGTNPDWIAMMGTPPATSEIVTRYAAANSLETLQLLVTPLAPSPTLLLYHLLQIVLWAMVAGLLGGLAESLWVQRSQPWRAIAIGLAGAAALLAGQLALATWLEQFKPDDFQWIVPGLFETALYAGLLAVFLEAARDFIERPLAFGSRARYEDRRSSVPATPARLAGIFNQVRGLRTKEPAQSAQLSESRPIETNPALSGYQPLPVPPNLPLRNSKKQPPDDIIKIELD